MTDFITEPTPHAEAIAFIESKTPVTKEVFSKMLPELRARAITVSGITSFDVLQRVRDEISTVHSGADWNTAKKKIVEEIHPFLADPEDPENTAAAERRAETLLRTHGFQASQAAAYRNINEQKEIFTHVEYHSMDDDRVRDTHAALDGLVFPFDSKFVQSHWCPWDYGCRCHWVQISSDEAHEIRKGDAKLPLGDRTLIEEKALDHLETTGHLMRGPNQITDLRTPQEKGGPDSYSFNPQDLHIPVEKLQGRYDSPTWALFEKWSRQTPVGGESKLTVWEWMSGKAVVAPDAPISLPVAHKETIDEIWHRLGLGKKITWDESDVHAIKKALVKPDQINPATKLISVSGNGLLKKGVGSESWVRSQFAEILSFLPKEVAEALPPLRIEISNTIGGGFGDYDPTTKVVRVARKVCLASVGGVGQFYETLWHETMHWIHMHGPESYRKTIAEHFAERTKGQQMGRLSGYKERGKEDHWYDAYAGRIYGPSLDTPEGSGIEVPTKYFQLLNNPGKLLRERNPLKINSAHLDETLRKVLSIFTGEHLA
jgi:SPP1 gp7 family putative phage head morphogenesis protein